MPQELKTASEWDAIKRQERNAKAHGFIQAAIRLAGDARRLLEPCTPEEEGAIDQALNHLLKAKSHAGRRAR